MSTEGVLRTTDSLDESVRKLAVQLPAIVSQL